MFADEKVLKVYFINIKEDRTNEKHEVYQIKIWYAYFYAVPFPLEVRFG